MSWVEALRVWNQNEPAWCIPRKGTSKHAEVKKIQKNLYSKKIIKSLPSKKIIKHIDKEELNFNKIYIKSDFLNLKNQVKFKDLKSINHELTREEIYKEIKKHREVQKNINEKLKLILNDNNLKKNEKVIWKIRRQSEAAFKKCKLTGNEKPGSLSYKMGQTCYGWYFIMRKTEDLLYKINKWIIYEKVWSRASNQLVSTNKLIKKGWKKRKRLVTKAPEALTRINKYLRSGNYTRGSEKKRQEIAHELHEMMFTHGVPAMLQNRDLYQALQKLYYKEGDFKRRIEKKKKDKITYDEETEIYREHIERCDCDICQRVRKRK